MSSELSLLHGPSTPPLLSKPLGTLIDEQAVQFGDRTAVVVSWQQARLSYRQLADRSKLVAKALLETGLKPGDHVGIMAGNRYEYIEVFLGAARIGCPVVLHNLTWSASQLQSAAKRGACKVIFMATTVGRDSLQSHIDALLTLPSLRRVVLLGDRNATASPSNLLQSYNECLNGGYSVFQHDSLVRRAGKSVKPEDVLTMMFTSGSTGIPKAAMLTHSNIINNAWFIGANMALSPADTIVCPPPLFHCFGITMALLAAIGHGSTIVFPSDRFNATETVDAVLREKATALLGVPTMFLAELEVLQATRNKIDTVRTGIIAGTSVPAPLMQRLKEEMGIDGLLIAYGMTETSPVTFMTALSDPYPKRVSTLGKVMPHTGVKVIDQHGNIVPRNQRGEICTSGYALMKGYYQEEDKTREAMRTDSHGTVWIHTGDEGFIDEDGYGHITGRIKDLIIRGGENIAPAEIEERLLAHPAIAEACVVGLEDKRYGEVVSAFLRLACEAATRPSDSEVQRWVVERLGRTRAPVYVFWMGEGRVGNDLPKTGSGKIQKHLVRDMGMKLLRGRVGAARL